MGDSLRRRLLIAGVVAVVIALVVVGGLAIWRAATRSPLEEALGRVPAASKRVAFTDWREVRRAVGAHLSASSDRADVEAMVDRAYDKDLSAASSIDESAGALQQYYGFGPATADWEAYAQATSGSTMVLSTPDSDFEKLADHLRELGYQPPNSDDGVWAGGTDLVAQIDGTLSPELQYVVLLKDKGLVVSSDSQSYAKKAAAVASGNDRSLADTDRVGAAGSVSDSAAAIVWAGDFACEDLAMSRADEEAQQQARQLIAEAGTIDPLTSMVMSMDAHRTLTVAMGLADSDQADHNLRTRARLAVGPAAGRGDQSFADDFKLTASRTRGSTVVLTMKPTDPTAFVLSALYDGPVVFATC